ncbi:MAG TPA: hypothetical protein VGO61_16780 [Steroidobacteraceae bacterium]|jgi:hypothetical protein|nr:hypothetical protein [Steroidobacteraceae bacterium]
MSAIVRSTRTSFYPLIAIALVLFIIVGFSRTYYLRFLSGLPPLSVLIHLHGLVFTAWLALFITQTQLIAAHRVDLHMKLGMAGVVLAFFVVTIGVATVFGSAATPRVHSSGLSSPQFSIVGFVTIGTFATLVALGVALRRRASLHKRFMLLAMVGAAGPATGRIIGLIGAGKYALLVQMGVIAAFVMCCLVYDWRRNRVVHPVFAVGGLVMLLLWPLRYAVARSEAWQPIGEWIAKVGKLLV